MPLGAAILNQLCALAPGPAWNNERSPSLSFVLVSTRGPFFFGGAAFVVSLSLCARFRRLYKQMGECVEERRFLNVDGMIF